MTAAESLRDVLQLITDNVLVRNTDNDNDSAAYMRQAMRIATTLKTAYDFAATDVAVGETAQPKVSEALA